MATARHPGYRSVRELRADLLNLADRLADLGDVEPNSVHGLRKGPGEVTESLGLVLDQLSRPPADGQHDHERALLEVIDVLEHWAHHRVRALAILDGAVAAALETLNGCRDRSELVELVCPEAARAFGCDVALLALLSAGTWSPGPGHPRGSRSSQPDTAPSGGTPLAGLPVESEVIREGGAVALEARSGEFEELPEAFRQLTTSAPYIMAPILIGPDAVALLYLTWPSRSMVPPDEHRDRVQRFASGFGLILERELLYDRFRSQRKTMRATMGAMERIMSSLDTGVDLVRLAGRSHADTVSAIDLPLNELSSSWDKSLTKRERDVMRLLVLGHDNPAIAAQLAVTPSTVKTHVRHAMRKLGAVNRTELIARYQGVADTSGSSGRRGQR